MDTSTASETSKPARNQVVFGAAFRKETIGYLDSFIKEFNLKKSSGYEVLILGLSEFLRQEKCDAAFIKELLQDGQAKRDSLIPRRENLSAATVIRALTPEQLKEMVEKYHPEILNK